MFGKPDFVFRRKRGRSSWIAVFGMAVRSRSTRHGRKSRRVVGGKAGPEQGAGSAGESPAAEPELVRAAGIGVRSLAKGLATRGEGNPGEISKRDTCWTEFRETEIETPSRLGAGMGRSRLCGSAH